MTARRWARRGWQVAALAVLLVLGGHLHGGAAPGPLRPQLIGAWRLISSEQLVDGEAPVFSLGPSPAGMITYTPDGRMQAQLGSTIRPKVRAAEASLEQQRELLRTYTAYFGTFDVDETAGTVTHHRDGTQVPGDRDFVRTITQQGSRLVLVTPTTVVDGKKRHARITWERLGPVPAAAPFDAGARKLIAGTWELVKHQTTLPGGQVRDNFGPAPKGLFFFDASGHMSVQIVDPGRPAAPFAKATDDEVRAMSRGYLAYFGSYDVDPATTKIVLHTTADLNPLNNGVDQIRFYELNGDTMVLQPPPAAAAPGATAPVTRITWRRVK